MREIYAIKEQTQETATKGNGKANSWTAEVRANLSESMKRAHATKRKSVRCDQSVKLAQHRMRRQIRVW